MQLLQRLPIAIVYPVWRDIRGVQLLHNSIFGFHPESFGEIRASATSPLWESYLLDPRVQAASVNQVAGVSLLRQALAKMDGFLFFGLKTLLVVFSFGFYLVLLVSLFRSSINLTIFFYQFLAFPEEIPLNVGWRSISCPIHFSNHGPEKQSWKWFWWWNCLLYSLFIIY